MRDKPIQILLTKEEVLILKRASKIKSLKVASFVRSSAITESNKIIKEAEQ